MVICILYLDSVQPHLKKCFEGVSSLDFGEDLEVLGVRSNEGESITLCEPVQTRTAKGQVEKWLVRLESEVKNSIKMVIQNFHFS